mgnify:FL=1
MSRRAGNFLCCSDPFEFETPRGDIDIIRKLKRFPYVPSDPEVLDERCFEIYNIQVHSLIKRLNSTGIEKLVIGVSVELPYAPKVESGGSLSPRSDWRAPCDSEATDSNHALLIINRQFIILSGFIFQYTVLYVRVF